MGKIDKVERAIARLQAFEPEDGYHLAFSGGKDSVTILALADMSGVKYDAHFALTTVDPPELVQFVKSQDNVQIHRPRETMWQLIIRKKVPPTRLMRYCCSELKEIHGNNRTVITGIRWAESKARKSRAIAEIQRKKKADSIMLYNDNDMSRRIMENCQIKGKRIINPIIDWTTGDVWEFLTGFGIPYCGLYDEGFSRLGCIGCPLASTPIRYFEFARWPKYQNAYICTFQKMIQNRKETGMDCGNWKTGEAVFNWWMRGDTIAVPSIGQTIMEIEP